MVVIVTGANGQLGQALQFVACDYPEIKFHFYGSADLDITKIETIRAAFSAIKPDFCVNAAAYTAVDKAENDIENAYLVNVSGAKNIAEICNAFQTNLIHISTDFVFDGMKQKPYIEEDVTNPKGVYGYTKLEGENEIRKIFNNYFIVRTSWVYSQFGNNFMKTMLKLARERDSLSVVNDQVGTPTHAIDLAKGIVNIIQSKSKNFGIYHFSNEGSTTWYDFAQKIFDINKVKIALQPICSNDFPTAATRPKYSVLDKSKIKSEFAIKISSWDEALEKYSVEK